MLDTQMPKAEDLQSLDSVELKTLAAQMLTHIARQSRHIELQAQGIKWRDAKIQSITFELLKLKAWRFGAKTERMNAQQREIFEETFAADQASAGGAARCPAGQQARRHPRHRCTPGQEAPPAQA